ncbi:glycoside hydrolase family 127 protein [Weissella paramesenteroides]|uniref:glycoside hydrolase family 127 protein n=1 Tax=Weissella paramesenteroides TaxID=1249 RepID=UPI00207392BA|nr:beta-L-arabinofuranosidase domain-containing protein [Weissella paramesenteroides]MCM6765041.1 glycoside hydrolase family 127 protein [Weissella paramesenteroides]MCM6767850.1 glycoside hydrolase family 127 protein [Weissella paramesenteroides]MCM6768876.1 glycoside hydrolase family 127 protein [Weissella paramesenteroides]MCM6770980.1 glycoside hydrolase family 127 protein [Weissella paramesenteroides]MCM6780901.1 glycoside hydrolase family 127 protein [Weissella paramesenteroides]
MSHNETIQLNQVQVTSEFWQRYRNLVVKEVLPYQWEVMNDQANINIADDPQNNGQDKNSHAIANLKIAAGLESGHHYGFPFQDTDVYKWLEAAAYSFSYHQDDNLKKMTDELIDLIADAQDDDGYLSTYFQIDAPERKFKRLQQSHELYTMGHYIEAGVAYYQATGNQKALQIAERMADCIDKNFGLKDGQIHGYDGHPEIELALARLFEATQEQRYLDLAHYFLNQRGQNPEFFDEQIKADGVDRDLIAGMRDFPRRYYQAAEPIKDQETADGHAVRVVYLCTGMAMVARHTGDQELLAACKRFWNDIVKRRMYITGNIGSTTTGEAFTYDYDLPNDTMYGETCASVGMSFFAKEMLKIEAKGEYGDILEKKLFNGSLSGMSLDGKHFFYVNPLEADPTASKLNPGKSHILTHRADWFGCACCPANLARLITSVDQYIYTVHDNTILSHQFIANEASFSDGVTVTQTNNFPWQGDIKYHLENANHKTYQFGIRVPQWSQAEFSVAVNGQNVDTTIEDGFIYLTIDQDNVDIELTLNMTTKLMRSNNRVKANFGQVAVTRGPLVYAAEEADNEAPLWDYHVNTKDDATYDYQEETLGGVGVITVPATREQFESIDDALYKSIDDVPNEIDTQLTLVPYYSWANRLNGQMRVWLYR